VIVTDNNLLRLPAGAGDRGGFAGLCGATNVTLSTPAFLTTAALWPALPITLRDFPVGTNTVTWTATDSHGNTATCSQLVIVTDNQPPSITCPAGDCGCFARSVRCDNVTLSTPTVSDNCGAVASITNNAPAMFRWAQQCYLDGNRFSRQHGDLFATGDCDG